MFTYSIYKLFPILETGFTYRTLRTVVMYNWLQQSQWPALEAMLSMAIVWSLSCKKTARGVKKTRSLEIFSSKIRL